MPEISDTNVDDRMQMLLDEFEAIKTKLDTIAANQGTQETEINLVKVELQGCNSKLSDIKTAVEGTLDVSII